MTSPNPFVCQPSGPDLRLEDVEAFEKRWNLRLPETYRSFMLSCNGGAISRPLCNMAGESLYAQFLFQLDPKGQGGLDYETRSISLPQGWLPVILEGSGGRIVLSADEGTIWYAPPEAWTTKRSEALDASICLAVDWEAFAASCTGDSGERVCDEELINRIVRNSDIAQLDHLIAQGFDVNSRNASDHTMVHLAALKQNYEFLEALLERGASLSGALHTVASVGSFPTAKWLHAHGASLEERNADGKLPEEVCGLKFVANLLKNLRIGTTSQ